MAYNKNKERLLNAIKTNTANTSVTLSGDVNAVDAQTKQAIIDTEASNDTIVTNTSNTNASVQALQGDPASTALNTLYEVIAAINALTSGGTTLKSLNDLLTTIDVDTGDIATDSNTIASNTTNIDTSLNNIETNSNTSLGKNGLTYHAASLTTAVSGKAAVQFILESVVADIEIGGISTGIAGTIPAGTIIYGDITDVTITSGESAGFILYNES